MIELDITAGHTDAAPDPRAARALPIPSIVVVALLCGLLAYGSSVLARGSGDLAAVWLPNAVVVAILGRRADDPVAAWAIPAFLAVLAANLLVGDSAIDATGLAFANLLEVLLCVGVMRRTGNGRPDLSKLPDLVRFGLVGGILGPACSGLFAISILQPVTLSAAVSNWAAWSLTNGLAMVLLVPLLWIFHAAWRTRSRPSYTTLREWAVIVILGAILTLSVFSQDRLPWLFLVVPVVFIHSFRLGLLGTACSIINIGIIALIITTAGSGPVQFFHASPAMQLFTLQLFLATSFAMGMTVAVILEDRRRAITDLTEVRDLHQSMLKNMRETVFRTDVAGRWVFLNPAWEKLTGYSVEESLGRNSARLLQPDDRAASVNLFRSLVAGEALDITMNKRIVSAQGDLRTIEFNARALRDPDGRLVGTIGNIHDITIQHQFEEDLLQSKREFETLATIAPVGISRCDSDGAIEYCNPAWLKLAGLTQEEARGTGWAKAVHVEDRDRVWADWHSAVAASSPYRAEFRFVTDTAVHWIDVIAEPEFAADGELKGFVAVLVDITERKALEETLVRARCMAEAADVAKSAFLANMSHEIRTPMNGVLGFADLLLDSKVDEESRGFAQMIVDSGREMMQLLNDILDLSKVEAGQMTIVSEPTDLAHSINRCIRLMASTARSKGVNLTLDLAADLPITIMGDGQRIRQVVQNLIANAVKFTDQGHVTVRARIVHETDESPSIQIEVEDSGIGISPHQQKAIFEPFAQADCSTARRYGGTGLGLTICRQLALGMNGTLSVDSEPGRGSIFCFALPLIMPPSGGNELDAGPPRPALPSTSGLRRPLNILLAEDLDINQQLMTAGLSRDGHQVTIANDGAEAIELIDQAAASAWMYDLVLMDLQMPNIDGFTAARTIRSRGHSSADLPIIALTANAFPDDIAACLNAGMQGHLAKPISRPALAEALSRWGHDDAAAVPISSADAGSGLDSDPKLRELYRRRKAKVLAQVERMVGEHRYDDGAAKALAAELHKLAGSAKMFGEPEVGTLTARLERQLLEWNAEERQLRVAAVAAQLQKASAMCA